MNWIKDSLEYIFNLVKIWVIINPWEQGIRVRLGKYVKVLNAGIYIRIPYFDSVFVQPTRLRVVENPIQTLTTKDGKTVSVSCVAGHTVENIEKLFENLQQPEGTISNIVLGTMNDFISKNLFDDLNPESIEENILSSLREYEEVYGLKFEYVKVINFACVRTYRLITDVSFMSDYINLDDKK